MLYGFFVVDEADGPDSWCKIGRMRLCQMGAAAALATKLSLRLSPLVNPVAQETRIAKPPSRQHKVDSQEDLGFPRDPGGCHGRARNRGARRPSGRGLQWEDAVHGIL